MALLEPLDPELAAMLGFASKHVSKGLLGELLDWGKRYKPQSYDEKMQRRRLYYEGKARGHLERALAARYPATYMKMSLAQVNLLRLIADVDASVYDYDPHRYLVDENGSQIADIDPATRRFKDHLDDSDLDTVMIEAERRLMIADTIPLRSTWEPLHRHSVLEPWWPSDVWAIPHARHPSNPGYFVSVIAKVAGPDGVQSSTERNRSGKTVGVASSEGRDEQRTCYEVWTREWMHDDEETGAPVFGPWFCETVDTQGHSTQRQGGAKTPYEGKRLPWVFLQNGIPDGCPWIDRNDELLDAIDTVLVTLTNIFFLVDMQAHSEKVLQHDGPLKESVPVGPNAFIKIPVESKLSTLDYNPRIMESLGVVKDYLKTIAISRLQSEDAYSWERKSPESGVSRRIKNEPQEKLRRKLARMRKRDEERYLLPLLIEQANLFGPRGKQIPETYRARMDPREPPDFEDPMQKQQRAQEAEARGHISKARAAVEAGWYPSLDAAREARLPTELLAAERGAGSAAGDTEDP